MKEVVFINAEMGHVLRNRCATLERRHVLGCSGEFQAGDNIYVVMRVRDGGQYVVATGVSCLDAATFNQGGGDDAAVIREQEMERIWT